MKYRELAPEAPLKDFVNKVWFLEQASVHKQEKILPLPAHHFIINLSNYSYRVVRQGEHMVNWEFADGFISGLQSHYLVIENPPVIRHVGIELKPYGLSAFTERPISSFTDVVQDSEVIFPGSKSLAVTLRQVSDPEKCLELFLNFIKTHLKQDFKLPPYISQSVNLLENDKTVTQAANLVGISHKHLINQWNAYCGTTPKHYQNIFRLQQLLNWLDQAEKPIRWSEVSNNFQYYDQPYFIRTFRKLSGFSPREYARLLDSYPSGTSAFVALDDSFAGVG